MKTFQSLKRCKLLFTLVLIFSPVSIASSQIVGGRNNGEIAPKSVETSKLSAGNIVSDVNVFSGQYNSTIPLGTVSTPNGTSFSAALSYNSNVSVGTTTPVCSGIPFGEGWNLNLPTITIETESYHKFTLKQERDQERPCLAEPNGQSDEAINYDGIGRNQGDLYYFLPQLNIPGIASGKLVFKYLEQVTIDGVYVNAYNFGLNSFSSPVEVRLITNATNGSTLESNWRITIEDGTIYEFNQFQYSYNAPENTRILTYDKCGGQAGIPNTAKQIINNESYGVNGTEDEDVKNVITPKFNYSAWYCTRISHPSAEQEEIKLIYQTYGDFNFHREFLHANPSISKDFTTSRDIFLKEIRSNVNGVMYEKLELDYKTLNNLLSLVPIIDYNDVASGAGQKDPLYSFIPVYSMNSSNIGSWSRYAHGKVNEVNSNVIEPTNPYAMVTNGTSSTSVYKRSSAPQSGSSLEFNHGFLESERISPSGANDQTMIPGDIYELKTEISNSRGTIDLAIVSGDLNKTPNNTTTNSFSGLNNQTSNGYAKVNYDATRGIELFSTFNSAIKWYQPLSSNNQNIIYTKNYFVMPNVPRAFEGFNIQIGPGNSDVDYNKPSNNMWMDNTALSPFSGKKAYTFMSSPINYKSSQSISHNFGNGFPWSMVMPYYIDVLGMPSGTQSTPDDNSPFYSWWSDGSFQDLSNPKKYNRPTTLGFQSDDNQTISAKLNSVQLIRYSKNPLMLQGVRMFRNNGGTDELVAQMQLEYDHEMVDLIENYNLVEYPLSGSTTAHADPNRKRVIVLLKEVKELPLDATLYTQNYGLPANEVNQIPTTFFEYAPLNLLGVTDIYSSIKQVPLYVISEVVDALGGITDVNYNPVQTSDLQSTMPSLIFNSVPVSGTPTYGNNQSFIVRPTVANVSKTSESGVQTYSYVYSNPVLSPGRYNLNDGNEQSPYHFRNGSPSIHSRGYKNVTIKKPLINGVLSRVDIEHYGILENDLVSNGSSYNKINYFCHGKVKTSKEYMDGILNNEITYIYGLTKAFQNAALRPSYFKKHDTYNADMTLEYLYEDYYEDEGLYTSLNEGTGTLEIWEAGEHLSSKGELPRLMEAYFYNDLIAANFNKDFLFDSYFVKLVSESKKDYEDGYYKNNVISGDPPENQKSNPQVIYPESCNQHTAHHRMFIETVTEYEYYEADHQGFAIGAPFQKLFGFDPENPEVISLEDFGYGEGEVSSENIQLKHEPSWQIATKRMYSPQMQHADTKEEFFYYFDLYNRYSRHWYFHDIVGNPDFEVQDFGGTIIAVNNRVPNSKRFIDYAIPRFDGLESSRFHNLRSLAFQKTAFLKNTLVTKPIMKSEFYEFDKGWEFQQSNNIYIYNPALLRFAHMQLDSLEYTDPSDDFRAYRVDRDNRYIADFVSVEHSMDPYGRNYLYTMEMPFDVLTIKTIENRNSFLQPTIISDQMGLKTEYVYNESLGDINFGKVESMTEGHGLSDLRLTEYFYTPKGLVEKLVLPNTQFLEYEYDDYLRLVKTTENGTRILKENDYHFWDQNMTANFSTRTEQNYASAKLHNSANANDYEYARAFVDPLGREASALKAFFDGTTWVKHFKGTLVYDNWNRVKRSHKPFVGALPSTFNLETNTSVPHSDINFENQVKSRPVKIADFGENILTSTHTIRNTYQIVNSVILFCELGLTNEEAKMVITDQGNAGVYKYYKTTILDQDDKVSIKYTNPMGQLVANLTYSDEDTKIITLFGYDSYGNVNRVINPEKQESNYLYNIAGLLVKETEPDDGLKKYMYNRRFQLSVSQNEEERARMNGSEPAPVYRVYKYDIYGNILSQGIMNEPGKQDDPLRYETLIIGTTLPLTYKYIFSNLSTFDWTCHWEKNGKYENVIITTSPSYFVTTLYEKSFVYGGTPVTFNLGFLTNETSYNHLGVAIHTNDYEYDQNATIAVQESAFDPINVNGANPIETRIEYPDYNYRRSLLEEKIDLDKDGTFDFHIFNEYDGLNRLIQVNAAMGEVTDVTGTTKLLTFEYDVNGLVTKKRHFVDESSTLNRLAMEIENTYDTRNRLTEINTKQGVTSVYKNTLFYNGQVPMDGTNAVVADQNWNGNLNGTLSDYNFTTASNVVGLFDEASLYGFKYDKLNRLTHADARVGDFVSMDPTEGLLVGDAQYSYDKIGNIKSLMRILKGVQGAFTETEQWNYLYTAGTNRLSDVNGVGNTQSRSYSYDLNGNLTTDTYKQINQTLYNRASYAYRIQIDQDDVDYLYDTKDQRIFKRVNWTNNGNIVDEYYIQDAMGRAIAIRKSENGDPATWQYYLHGSSREMAISPTINQSPGNNNGNTDFTVLYGTTNNFVYDYLGNTRFSYSPISWNTTALVSEYKVNYAADYLPYAKVLREFVVTAPEKYLSTGHERDEETGLDYRGARYYDADVARFLSLDPLARKFPTWNAYNYVMGNPIIFIDPSGREPETTGWTDNHLRLNEIFGDPNGFNSTIQSSIDESLPTPVELNERYGESFDTYVKNEMLNELNSGMNNNLHPGQIISNLSNFVLDFDFRSLPQKGDGSGFAVDLALYRFGIYIKYIKPDGSDGELEIQHPHHQPGYIEEMFPGNGGIRNPSASNTLDENGFIQYSSLLQENFTGGMNYAQGVLSSQGIAGTAQSMIVRGLVSLSVVPNL